MKGIAFFMVIDFLALLITYRAYCETNEKVKYY